MASKEIKLTSYEFDATSVKRSVNKFLSFLHRDPALTEKLIQESWKNNNNNNKTTSLEISKIRLVKTSSISAKFEIILNMKFKVSILGYSFKSKQK